jgi:hypothetical protein
VFQINFENNFDVILYSTHLLYDEPFLRTLMMFDFNLMQSFVVVGVNVRRLSLNCGNEWACCSSTR